MSIITTKKEKEKNKEIKYPCCVCMEPVCLGADCPAANGKEEEYLARLKILINWEFPIEEEE
jgi:hypothetical protein